MQSRAACCPSAVVNFSIEARTYGVSYGTSPARALDAWMARPLHDVHDCMRAMHDMGRWVATGR